jgi:succinate dehydrogenase hydrophobic anchor subunit
MAEEVISAVVFAITCIVLIVLTPVISFGMWKFYRLLGVYHPTPSDLETYLEDKPEKDASQYISEDWFKKFGLTFAINFMTVGVALVLVLIYGLII